MKNVTLNEVKIAENLGAKTITQLSKFLKKGSSKEEVLEYA